MPIGQSVSVFAFNSLAPLEQFFSLRSPAICRADHVIAVYNRKNLAKTQAYRAHQSDPPAW